MQGKRMERGLRTNDGEACVWLRLAGTTSYLGHRSGQAVLASWLSWNSSKVRTRWAIGVRQHWRADMVAKHASRIIDIGHGSIGADVWALASPNYAPYLSRFIAAFHEVGDHVRLHLHWVPQLRDALRSGFQESFNYARLALHKALALFDALLWAALRPRDQSLAMVLMDLDVHVFPGWLGALEACTSRAHACLLQQPGHAARAAEPVNSGLLVLRRGSPQAATLPHALLARVQSTEIVEYLSAEGREHDQGIINAILRHVADERGSRSLRWGIYRPQLAYVGMYESGNTLSLRMHHATSSSARMPDKLRILTAQSKLAAWTRTQCGVSLMRGAWTAWPRIRTSGPHWSR